MRPEGSCRADFSRKGEKSAGNDGGRHEFRLCMESEKSPQDRDGEGTRIYGERKEEGTDDVGKYEG